MSNHLVNHYNKPLEQNVKASVCTVNLAMPQHSARRYLTLPCHILVVVLSLQGTLYALCLVIKRNRKMLEWHATVWLKTAVAL